VRLESLVRLIVKRGGILLILPPPPLLLRQDGTLLRNTPLFLEFSLCLSRACLGKMMLFIYKWRKKWRFRTGT